MLYSFEYCEGEHLRTLTGTNLLGTYTMVIERKEKRKKVRAARLACSVVGCNKCVEICLYHPVIELTYASSFSVYLLQLKEKRGGHMRVTIGARTVGTFEGDG